MTRVYWHGGRPGLRPGEYILPPAETGHPTTEDLHQLVTGEYDPPRTRVTRRDRVYLTSEFRYALHWAAVYIAPAGGSRPWGLGAKGGHVYEVEPEGELYHDPDNPRGLAFACRRARIVSVVVPTRAQLRRAVTARENAYWQSRIEAYDTWPPTPAAGGER
jgi:hypothetical protein